ncbi:hypothetical protein BC938DRAFT_470911 [Jimgerdemannia flammicorona]|uniref:F-box domain-containing protein n=1 Tax=Jimgerdemannia flammicorona TaxID=994334 RepID=A0A433QUX3_9FUNG|nr:hypothetical protein BC938DRAFT_470911 [Jimgerdemannia flammicorona]
MPSPQLPHETLTNIFTYFPHPDDLLFHCRPRSTLFYCSLVSKDWRAAALPLVWSTLRFDTMLEKHTIESLRRSMTNSRPDFACRITQSIAYVTTISLTLPPSEPGWAQAAASLLNLLSPEQLRKIHLIFRFGSTDLDTSHLLATVFPHLTRNLRHLIIASFANSGQEGDIVLRHLPPSLRTLYITNATSPNAKQDIPYNFSRMFSLTKLTDLRLVHVHHIPVAEFAAFLRTYGRTLCSLRLQNCPEIQSDIILATIAAHCSRAVTQNPHNYDPAVQRIRDAAYYKVDTLYSVLPAWPPLYQAQYSRWTDDADQASQLPSESEGASWLNGVWSWITQRVSGRVSK